LDKKRFLSSALGMALGMGVPWLVFKRDPISALLAVAGVLIPHAVMWLVERRRNSPVDRGPRD